MMTSAEGDGDPAAAYIGKNSFDVQRLCLDAAEEKGPLERGSLREKHERFKFSRDWPDLVAMQICLRTELSVQMVMAAVIPTSQEQPFLAYSRPEIGTSGNPHTHGFCYGARNPRLLRVKADVEEAGGKG